ncbi:MAG: hypothetical protein JWN46_3363 [Acidimicrobiales bacterium]|nr:hypothetical protein [Acidimicrobiales bacterium]
MTHDLSRRDFVRTTAAAGGMLAAAGVLRPAMAFAGNTAHGSSPRPIPWGFSGADLGQPSNHHVYHFLPPLPPGADGQPGQYTECSSITDFKGFLAAANIDGTGTGTPSAANPDGRYTFNVDMRVMKGVFIGTDGRQREGVFGFV